MDGVVMGMELLMARARLNHLVVDMVLGRAVFVGESTTQGTLALDWSAQAFAVSAGDAAIICLAMDGSGHTLVPETSDILVPVTQVGLSANSPSYVAMYYHIITSTEAANKQIIMDHTGSSSGVTMCAEAVFVHGQTSTDPDAPSTNIQNNLTNYPVTMTVTGPVLGDTGRALVAFLVNSSFTSAPLSLPSGWDGDSANADVTGFGVQASACQWRQHVPAGDVGTLSRIWDDTQGSTAWFFGLVSIRAYSPRIELTQSLGSLTVGTPFTGSVSAANVDGAAGTITINTSNLPAGLSAGTIVDNGDGSWTLPITGTPTTAGAYSSTLDATNGSQHAAGVWSGTVASGATSPTLVNTGGATGFSASISKTFSPMPTSGNLLVVTIYAGVGATPTATPTGWTAINGSGQSTSRPQQVFARISDGTETGFSATYSASAGYGITYAEWSNATTIAPLKGSSVTSPVTSATLGPSNSPPVPGALPLFFSTARDTKGHIASVPSGWTLPRADQGTFQPVLTYMSTAPGAAVSETVTLDLATDDFYQWCSTWIY